jgi:hypothetical protein
MTSNDQRPEELLCREGSGFPLLRRELGGVLRPPPATEFGRRGALRGYQPLLTDLAGTAGKIGRNRPGTPSSRAEVTVNNLLYG